MINDQQPVTSDLSLAAPLAQALIAARWSPEDELLAASLQRLVDGDDLLPTLRDVAQRWMTRATTPIDLRQAQQLVRLHDWLATTSAKLTCGWPGGTRNSFASWTGTSLIWWPHGIPVGRKVAWVSSRLGRAIDERHDWFAVLVTDVIEYNNWKIPGTSSDSIRTAITPNPNGNKSLSERMAIAIAPRIVAAVLTDRQH